MDIYLHQQTWTNDTRMKNSKGMFDYYDERAPEYDEIYEGGLPGIPEAETYKKDVDNIKAICADFGNGHLIDIACGTAYWLPYYAKNCSEITLVDQSRRMLAESRQRVSDLKLEKHVHYIKGDFFKVRFLSRNFDSAVVAFLLSHLTEETAKAFIEKLRRILNPGASILWIDGSWSPTRKKHRNKSGPQERKLSSGQSFTIFKRYFDEDDIGSFLEDNDLIRKVVYFGGVFFAVNATLTH